MQPAITGVFVRLAWVCALALASASSWAGTWQASATQVFRHAGMPANVFPEALLQDGQGKLWIASQSGLFKWDGYQLQRIGADAPKSSSLRSADIRALHEDGEGRLWIGTDGGGLSRLD